MSEPVCALRECTGLGCHEPGGCAYPGNYEGPVLVTREHAFRAAQNAVRSQGYAVALHGSQVKDLDLIAVPWRDTAITAQDVAEMIADAIPGVIEAGSPERKPHGRLSFTIRPRWHYGFDNWYVDLAVMPRDCDWPSTVPSPADTGEKP